MGVGVGDWWMGWEWGSGADWGVCADHPPQGVGGMGGVSAGEWAGWRAGPSSGFSELVCVGGVSEQLCPRFNLRASCSQFNSGKRLQCNRPLTPRPRAAHPTPGPVSHPGLPDQSQAGSHEGQGLEASALPSPAAWALGLGFLLSEPGFQRACRTHATCI